MHDEKTRFRAIPALAATAVACLTWLAAHPASANGIPRTPAPEGVSLYLISPHPGETVSSPVTVRFGLKGMGVAPAGTRNPKTGHHHLIIDSELPDPGKPVPADDKHRHFGGGQTEVSLDLPPGTHTLQLMLADHDHVSFDPPIVSERVTIYVK